MVTGQMQMIGLDWSKTKGDVMVVGECHFVALSLSADVLSKLMEARKWLRFAILLHSVSRSDL